jgi:hypothetical protein
VEGERLFLDASGSVDPDGDALTYEWDVFGDGAFRIPGPLSLQQLDWSILQAQGMDDGPATYTAFRVRVTDSAGNVAVSAPATFTVSDAPPAVVAGTAQAGPVLPGAAVTVGASFSDPGRDGPYAALWEWGDGTTTVQPDVAKGALSASHAYAGAGVYVPRLTITDADGIPGRATLAPVTVITPAEATQAVTRQVRALAAGGDLTAGQSAVLVSLLDVAARQLSRGNEAVAAIVLDVFRLAVNTYTRLGILTAGEANPLLRSTDQILANLRG